MYKAIKNLLRNLLSHKFPVSSKLWQEQTLESFSWTPSHLSHPPRPESAIFDSFSSSSSSFDFVVCSSLQQLQSVGVECDLGSWGEVHEAKGIMKFVGFCFLSTCRFLIFSRTLKAPIFSANFWISIWTSMSLRFKSTKWCNRAAPSIFSLVDSSFSAKVFKHSLSAWAQGLTASISKESSYKSRPLARCFWKENFG